ncbi:MAG: hypothetical protein MUF50_00420 [Planctomycetes bacterium]|nr:hypothetical protein [Planctomycetota bacterium]
MDNAKKAATIAYQDSVLNKKLVKLDKTDSIQAKKIAKISGQVAAVRNTCTENTAIITAMSISLQTVQKDVADMKGVSEVQVDAADEIVGQPGSLVKPNLGKTQ